MREIPRRYHVDIQAHLVSCATATLPYQCRVHGIASPHMKLVLFALLTHRVVIPLHSQAFHCRLSSQTLPCLASSPGYVMPSSSTDVSSPDHASCSAPISHAHNLCNLAAAGSGESLVSLDPRDSVPAARWNSQQLVGRIINGKTGAIEEN